MGSNITQPGSPQQGIHQCMEQHIGIGMTPKGTMKGNLHAAEDERPTILEAVQVETGPYSKQLYRPLFRITSAKRRSSGSVILILAPSPGTVQIASPNSSSR